jgi:uncharacterized membrane protein
MGAFTKAIGATFGVIVGLILAAILLLVLFVAMLSPGPSVKDPAKHTKSYSAQPVKGR